MSLDLSIAISRALLSQKRPPRGRASSSPSSPPIAIDIPICILSGFGNRIVTSGKRKEDRVTFYDLSSALLFVSLSLLLLARSLSNSLSLSSPAERASGVFDVNEEEE